MSIKNKIIMVALGGLIALLFTGILNYLSLGSALETSNKIHSYESNYLVLAKNIKYNISQVQQWLTDISATRGAAGYDDGFKNAEIYASAFKKDLDELEKIAKEYDNPKLKEQVAAMRVKFDSFYDIGKNMADIYIKEGPAGGNEYMGTFDVVAESMLGMVDELEQDAQTSYTTELETMTSDISSSQNITLTLLVVFSAMAILVSVVMLKSIESSMKSFHTGFISFFDYLNKKTSTIHPLDLSSKDELSEMAHIINENIAQTKANLDQDEANINTIVGVMSEFESGNFSKRVEVTSNNELLLKLIHVINNTAINVEKNLTQVLNVMNQYSSNDFTNRVNIEGLKEHLLILATGVNRVGDAITQILVENKSDGEELLRDSNILRNNVSKLNSSSNQQAASLEETSAAVEEISSNIAQTAQRANQMSQLAKSTKESAEKGGHLSEQTQNAMDEIFKATEAINEAIVVIDQIAFQTNILSLNAAVEAATAGDAGKGFAVVAGEVRNLANRSAEAAKVIKELVTKAQAKAHEGRSVGEEMAKGYEELKSKIENTSQLVADVANASQEQMSGMQQISNSVSQLDQVSQANAIAANETNDIAYKTDSIAQKIVTSVNQKRFKG